MDLRTSLFVLISFGAVSASVYPNYCRDKDSNNQITCDGFELFPEKQFAQQQPDQYQIKCANPQEPRINLTPKLFYFRLYNFTIDNCNIKVVEKDAFSESVLTTLTLTNNKIEDINDKAFRGIEGIFWIYLNNNQIKRIRTKTFGNLGNYLEAIYLQDNLIEHIEDGAFKYQKNLQELRLNNNEIKRISQNIFRGLENLDILYLNHNKIEKLYTGTFDELKNLKTLYLDANKITKISSKSFVHNSKLEFLNLKSNNINTIEKNAFDGLSSAKLIFLNENPISEVHQQTFYNISTNFICVALLPSSNIKYGALSCGKQM